jgi:hypothetical protein
VSALLFLHQLALWPEVTETSRSVAETCRSSPPVASSRSRGSEPRAPRARRRHADDLVPLRAAAAEGWQAYAEGCRHGRFSARGSSAAPPRRSRPARSSLAAGEAPPRRRSPRSSRARTQDLNLRPLGHGKGSRDGRSALRFPHSRRQVARSPGERIGPLKRHAAALDSRARASMRGASEGGGCSDDLTDGSCASVINGRDSSRRL